MFLSTEDIGVWPADDGELVVSLRGTGIELKGPGLHDPVRAQWCWGDDHNPATTGSFIGADMCAREQSREIGGHPTRLPSSRPSIASPSRRGDHHVSDDPEERSEGAETP